PQSAIQNWFGCGQRPRYDLHVPPANRLEKLAGDRSGQYSIRINDQWRICFEWQKGNVYKVEIVDYH
ncbi:MAG: type II toxin-antitoxin system RelE/ParE family toxin, partial [bacterium]|nr:type II toxin-antitoxin system RelE/ParE family toxin [bacterium]